jgi:hypothetical protein
MKLPKIYIVAFLVSSTFTYGQSAAGRIDATDRDLPSPAKEAVQASSGGASDVSASDTGAQRPLLLKKSGFSAQFGYDSKISYKQNPLGAPGILDQQADAVWENRFHGRAKLGVYDMDSSVVTPFIGGSWAMTDFTYKNDNDVVKDLSTLNFNTTTAYLLFLMQHESGWAFRGGVMYANDRSTEDDTEEYSEFYPSIGVTKAYALNDNALGVLDASFGSHYGTITDVDGSVATHTSDELDHIDLTVGYSIIYSMDNFTIRPSYSISYRKYDNGFNFDRKDTLHSLGLHIDYPISESFDLMLFTDYAKRTSSGSHDMLYEFEKFDIGSGLGLTARF